MNSIEVLDPVDKEQKKKNGQTRASDTGLENKPIFHNHSYAVPDKIHAFYIFEDGKFKDKFSDALRFEDHGKKLSTPVEDRKVIADMVLIANAKNWTELELKGTDTFKQLAWLEAQSRGIQTKGYEPTERDLEQLQKLKQERTPNEILLVTRTLSADEKMKVDVASKVLEKEIAKYPENVRKEILSKVSASIDKGDLKLPTPKISERTVDQARPAPAPSFERSR